MIIVPRYKLSDSTSKSPVMKIISPQAKNRLIYVYGHSWVLGNRRKSVDDNMVALQLNT